MLFRSSIFRFAHPFNKNRIFCCIWHGDANHCHKVPSVMLHLSVPNWLQVQSGSYSRHSIIPVRQGRGGPTVNRPQRSLRMSPRHARAVTPANVPLCPIVPRLEPWWDNGVQLQSVLPLKLTATDIGFVPKSQYPTPRPNVRYPKQPKLNHAILPHSPADFCYLPHKDSEPCL